MLRKHLPLRQMSWELWEFGGRRLTSRISVLVVFLLSERMNVGDGDDHDSCHFESR